MKVSSKILALVVALALPLSAQAHKAWLLPSDTVLSGADPWITVDAAVSNDLFYFNHVPLRLDALTISGPDGQPVSAENSAKGKYRSTFDVHLSEPGTYRIAVVNAGLFASWEENGKPKRWRGNAESFASEVPKHARDLKVSQSAGRIETFVTAGRPNEIALKPTGTGLELVPVTHPNDLFAGEAATFKLLLDGEPAKDLSIEIIPDGIRYRDKQNEMTATSDKDGQFSVTWPSAGRYWLHAEHEDDKTSMPQATQRRASYSATLEVLPQ
ncbi:MAG TPA: DUF4198 domain-containing protein [Dokdonella sp.]|uniref:DUF4198 domain-containing protein n=1 Tax=Dokdonella sp. TaxID=2291710 RepID=UPI002D800109|nr:DUF4198 domain-containing protein [Dokdonella sp.]HET9033086.1 DUF4198 domain-containing protein [Dokdonella sp.]